MMPLKLKGETVYFFESTVFLNFVIANKKYLQIVTKILTKLLTAILTKILTKILKELEPLVLAKIFTKIITDFLNIRRK